MRRAQHVSITAFAAIKAGSELAAGTTLAFTVHPAASETTPVASHEVQVFPIPRHWSAKIIHSAAGSWTYSLGYHPLSA